MSPRAYAPPPQIPNFTFVRELGKGGFADVYLYQQIKPRRDVAVKVLIAEMAGSQAEDRLNREADAMAGLSQHQNIVTVFQSGISPDRRAYMVMEYYPRPALSHGLRQAQRSLAKVLSIGVQLAGAVESAHRAGILHRDIKPANILVDRQDRPVLGDFGIAMTNDEAERGHGQGFSIPWSPPESFSRDARPSVQTDIWSLAATVYALLTGRAPFEIPGGDNRDHAMMDRIQSTPYRPTGRMDVPGSLEQVLATAMAKSPQNRYTSMKAFGMALQQVEQELSLPMTRLDIIDDAFDDEPDDDLDDVGTRLRPITVVDPTGAGSLGSGGVSSTVWPTQTTGGRTGDHLGGTTGGQYSHTVTAPESWAQIDRTQVRPSGDAGDYTDATVYRPASIGEPGAEELEVVSAPAKGRGRVLALIVGLVVVVIAAVVGIVIFTTGDEPLEDPVETGTPTMVVQDPVGGDRPPDPVDLAGVVNPDGVTAHFTWTNPDPAEGDSYRVSIIGGTGEPMAISEEQVDVDIPEGATTVCVQVRVVRGGKGSGEVEACAV